jgi:hypothetical protein
LVDFRYYRYATGASNDVDFAIRSVSPANETAPLLRMDDELSPAHQSC